MKLKKITSTSIVYSGQDRGGLTHHCTTALIKVLIKSAYLGYLGYIGLDYIICAFYTRLAEFYMAHYTEFVYGKSPEGGDFVVVVSEGGKGLFFRLKGVKLVTVTFNLNLKYC